MRKWQIFLGLFFAVNANYAQISIESKNMPSADDTARLSTADIASLPASWQKAGANQNWDFSKITPQTSVLREFQSSSRTFYAFYFFNQIGEKFIDTLGAGPVSFTNIYNFFTKTSKVYKAEGIGYTNSGIPLAAKYTDDDEIYQFPLEYNDSDVSTFRFKFEIPGQQFLTYIQKGTRTNIVDAYGSITTPFKTYSNVLRVKTIMNQVDSLVTPFISTPIPRPQVIYKWLSTDEIVPVMEIRGIQAANGSFTATEIFYKDSLIGNENNNSAFMQKMERNEGSCTEVFPNPAVDRLNLQFVCPTLVAVQYPPTIEVVNATGLRFTIPQVKVSDELQYYNISELPQGVYSLRFMGSSAHFVKL